MRLVMSRVTEDDLDELFEVQFKSFAGLDIHDALFGPNTKEHRDNTKARFLKYMKEDSADCWLKIVDEETGRIVSGSNWKIYPTWAAIESHPVVANWYSGEEKEMAEYLANDFMERRCKYMYNHAHILLYILFTDPAYQKHGAGSMHVKWGCELADRLLIPTWVEASAAGHHLYESNGFVDLESVNVETKKWASRYTMMRREGKTSVEGGRSVDLHS